MSDNANAISVDNQTMEYYLFLNRLRESGKVNMFGAKEVLIEFFDLSPQAAHDLVTGWMKWFGEGENSTL